jgi:V8-like Glu-specific endopeptidase
MMYAFRWCLLVWLLGSIGCWSPQTTPTEHAQQAVIYGQDDRKEVYEHPDKTLQKMALSVGVLALTTLLKEDPQTGTITYPSEPHTDNVKKNSNYPNLPLCQDEAFRTQPIIGGCTAFLVGPRTVVTAAHCVDANNPQKWCTDRSLVLGYRYTAADKLVSLTKDDVYQCAKLIVRKLTSSTPVLDVAVLELARDVIGRTPLIVDESPSLSIGDPLAIIGHPHGLPLKIATGATVTQTRSKEGDYFLTGLDAYPGNSGSPVIHATTYKVLGIHVRGFRPVYETDANAQCLRSHIEPDPAKGTLSATYAYHYKNQACQSDVECPVGQECKDKACLPKQPDLQISQLTITPTTFQKGDTITIQFEVANKGNGDIRTPFRVGIWTAGTGPINPKDPGHKLLGSKPYSALAANASVNGSITVTAGAPLVAGTQVIGAFADDQPNPTTPSLDGLVAESNEQNNEKNTSVIFKQCQDACPKADDTTCKGNDVQICQLASSGCLEWRTKTTCSAPDVCQNGTCSKNCTDACTQANETTCQGNTPAICSKQANGCLGWVKQSPCTDQQECKAGACQTKPPPTKQPNGSTCKTSAECQSNACVQGTCQASCKAHKECASTPQTPFCTDENVCKAIPQGRCFTPLDCSEKGSTCDNNTCAPPKGCGGCQHTQETPPHTLILLLLFAFLFRQWSRR